ncbi:hypothetical protein GCM10025865_14440 [Paraoerskovia sediminicola]|uniref:Integral membrane protein n=1 Tax=Paraoerskovia sediminicola TaxID=1138587 RepID=A0ABM8G213_9CELL|nr:hypothetical protein GCM10025865_14440 [Paraoerskovia sediminicola]
MVLVVLAVLIAVLAVPARYVQQNVLETEGYVELVGPLASDPAVQTAVADALTDQVMTQLDVEAIVTDNVEAFADRDRVPDAVEALGPILTNQIEQLVQRAADKLVTSEQFAAVWVTANRVAHGTATTVLEGHDGKYLDIDAGTISVPLDGLVLELRDRLVDAGLERAANIEPQGREIVLVQSDQLGTAQQGLVIFQNVAGILPWLVILLIAGAAWVAPRRRHRVVVAAAISIGALMALMLAGLALASAAYLGNLPLGAVGLDATRSVTRALLDPLRTQLWWWVGLSVVVAAAAIAWPWAVRAVGRRRTAKEPAATVGGAEA